MTRFLIVGVCLILSTLTGLLISSIGDIMINSSSNEGVK